MIITQNHSYSRKDLALVTFGHRIASQLRAFFANFSETPISQLVTSIEYQPVQNPSFSRN
jgi:hypothetical protein